MIKLRKALLSAIIVGCMATSLCAVVSADETGTGSVVTENVLEGTIGRVTASAFILKTDDGKEYAVASSDAQSFAIDDVVKVTYSGQVTERQGKLTVVADSVTLLSETVPVETPVDTPVADTTTEPTGDTVTGTTTAPVITDNKANTPDTGNEDLVAFATLGLVGGLSVAVYCSSKREKE